MASPTELAADYGTVDMCVSNATTAEPYSGYGYFNNQSLFDYLAEQTASALNVYYTPILVVLGTLGNLLSIYVFFASKLRHQSTSQYLSALALSDTVFLMQLIPPWLNALQLTGVFHRNFFCQIFVYVSYVCSCLSAWLVVAFTIERFVAVLYPLRRTALCTVSRARLIIIGVTLAAIALNLPVLRFATPEGKDCNIDYEYIEQAARFNLVDTAVAFTLPLAVIIVLNTWIVVGVCQLERTRQILMKAQRRPARLRALPVTACPRSQQRVTRMLLLVSSVFVVLNLPAYTMRIVAYAYDITLSEYSGRWAALQQVALMFFNTNFGINFILYCLSGQNFRRNLRQTLPCLRGPTPSETLRCTGPFHRFARASSVSTSFVSAYTEATVAGATTPCARRRRPRYEVDTINWALEHSRQTAGQTDALPPPIEMQDLGRRRRARARARARARERGTHDVAVQTQLGPRLNEYQESTI